MGFIIEIMVFLVISSMVMLFVAPTKEVVLSRNSLARDVKQIIKDNDTQKAINNEIESPEIIEKKDAVEKDLKDELPESAIIYNKLDQEVSQKDYSYKDKRYNVTHTKKVYDGQEIPKDSRWVGNISNFNYKINKKMKIDIMLEDYLENILDRKDKNEELNLNDIPIQIQTSKKRVSGSAEDQTKYNDKNKLMIIKRIYEQVDSETWNIEYVEIKDINKEHDRYVIKYDIIKGKIKVEKNKVKSDAEKLKGIEYDLDFLIDDDIEEDIDNGIKKNRLIIQTN